MAVFEELGTDPFLSTPSEQDAVRENDGHDPFVLEEVESMEQEGKVGSGLGRKSMAFESHIVCHAIAGFPTITKRWISDDRIKGRFLGRIEFAHLVPLVKQGVAVKNLELGVLHTMQQHVHPRKVVGGDILFLAKDLADGPTVILHPFTNVEKQGSGATGKVHDAFEAFLGSSPGLLAIEGDDRREDVGELLRGIELTSFLAGTSGELADEVLVRIPQRIDIGRKIRKAFGDPLDDRAELGVSIGIGSTKFIRAEIDLRKEALEGAFEGFVFDVFEAVLEGAEQFAALRAGHVSDAAPEVRGLDDVVHLTPHLHFELRYIVGVVGIPEC